MFKTLARGGWFCLAAVLACLGVASAAQAQNRYYIDAATGSDANDGRAADRAWKSLVNVDKTRLAAGDAILLRRGGTWTGQITLKDSGRPGRPITIAGYGTGPSPVLTDAVTGINGNGQSYIVVRDIKIQNMKGPGIGSSGSTDWRIEKVTIDHTGQGHDGKNRDFAGIQFWRSRDIVIDGAMLTNIRGDGIWGWELQNLRIVNSRVEVCQGDSADNVHLYAPRNYEIRDNFFSMEGKTDSHKGNVHSQGGSNGVIEHNEFRGGNYGVGITDDNLLVRHNRFFNHTGEKWAASIIVSEVYDVRNNTFADNTMTNAIMGIYIFQDKYNRENFRIEDNVFERIRRGAMVVESPISGVFVGNTLRESPGAKMVVSNDWVVRGQTWREGANQVANDGARRESSGQAQ
jgi:Right handed beta helix region